jgi:predicted Zn-dependent peptidase
VANASLEDVKAFFFNFYAPNNATLVVSGGVPREEVERLAEKWFGPIPARDVHKKPRTQEPPQEAPRSKTLYSTMAPHARVYKAYHIPGRSEPGYMPAEVIAELLTSGKSAWLYKRMVKDKEVASNIAAYSWGLFDTGQFSIDGTVAEGKSVAAYESALEAVLSELPNITAEELTRQKNKLEAEETFMKTSVMSRALGLALGDAIGDPDLINQELERIRQLQPQDIAHFAQQHFRPQNAATLYYLPEN